MTEYDFILRLVLALVFGGVIGIERKRVGKAAGFRTQMMVCLGSALFTILSFYGAQFAGFDNVDPSRIAASIVVGQEVPVPNMRSGYSYNPSQPDRSNIPYGGLSGGAGRGISREDVGVKMTVTPHINEGDYITSEIEIEVSQPIVSDVGIDPNDPQGLKDYLGDRDTATLTGGTGTFDHIAFSATGLGDMLARLRKKNVAYRERAVPDLGLHQVFLDDPSGVVIELNYPANEKAAA